jgi:hypothetical protein
MNGHADHADLQMALNPMPPATAGFFTMGQVSVLRAIARDIQQTGECRRLFIEIAAEAGCSVGTVLIATAEARRRGLLSAKGLIGSPMWIDYLRASPQARVAMWERESEGGAAEGRRAWQDELRREAAKEQRMAERVARTAR